MQVTLAALSTSHLTDMIIFFMGTHPLYLPDEFHFYSYGSIIMSNLGDIMFRICWNCAFLRCACARREF